LEQVGYKDWPTCVYEVGEAGLATKTIFMVATTALIVKMRATSMNKEIKLLRPMQCKL